MNARSQQTDALLFQVACGQTGELAGLMPADWQQLGDMALAEGLAGLLYVRCLETGVVLPPTIQPPLQQAYRRIAADNVRAWQRLQRLLEAIAAQDLALILLPGAALMALYPDPGCRAMDDMDVLMRPDQADRVRACLSDHGFTAVERHEGLYIADGLVLDLHEDLFNIARVKTRRYIGWMDPAQIWQNRQQQVIEGVPVDTMDAEDALIFTAVHALKHTYNRLTWMLDLYWLGQRVDWHVVAHRATQYGLARPLHYGLVMLQTRLGVSLPPDGQAWSAAHTLGTAEHKLLNRAFDQRQQASWGDLLLACNVRAPVKRVIFLAETYFPRPAVLLQVFPYIPRPLFPLAYVLRFVQVLWVGMRQIPGLLKKPKA